MGERLRSLSVAARILLPEHNLRNPSRERQRADSDFSRLPVTAWGTPRFISMMIDDDEIRNLFKTESEERLHRLDEGLLRLEAHPDDRKALEEVFREAHTLKGSARMVGADDVAAMAHRFEDLLGAVKQGSAKLSSDLLDRLYRSLDTIRELLRAALAGEPPRVDLQTGLALLERAPEPVVTSEISSTHAIRRPTELAHKEPSAAPDRESAPPRWGSYRIETIRVEPQKLDALMTFAGELMSTNLQIGERFSEIEELTALAEEWSREALASRFTLRKVESAMSGAVMNKLAELAEREQARVERLGALVARLRDAAYEDDARLDFIANRLEENIRSIRLLPLATVFALFPRMVRDLAKEQSKEISFYIRGGETTADKRILEEMKDPLMHMIRNAIDHGIEKPDERERLGKPRMGSIELRASQTASGIVIEVADNGRGLDLEAIKRTALKRKVCREDDLAAMTPAQIQSLIFAPGFSTRSSVTEISGRGVGLDVVRAQVERLKGTLQVESAHGMGCTITVQLPVTLATAQVLRVAVQDQVYALPVEYVHTCRLVPIRELVWLEGRPTVSSNGRHVSVAWMADLLEMRTRGSSGPPAHVSEARALMSEIPELPCVILSIGGERLGVFVDILLDTQDIVVKPLGGVLKRVRNVSGATILGTGVVAVVLNPHDLMKSARRLA